MLHTPIIFGVAESGYETAILCVDSLRLCVFARDKNHTLIQQRRIIDVRLKSLETLSPKIPNLAEKLYKHLTFYPSFIA